jgi:glyoxylase-like metal-dependent hydrolase (beta-lactamase superfamily II)
MKINNIRGNTYFIDTGRTYIPFYKLNENEVILMDSGLANREGRNIDKILEENHFKVAGIICTHAHSDHVGNNAFFKRKYNSVIAMPAYEALICSSLINLKSYYSNLTFEETKVSYSHMICHTDILISEEDSEVEVCGIRFNIYHTPGHSAEHVCIITPDDVAYLGDCLISYEVMRASKIPYAYILSEDLTSKEKLYSLKSSVYIIAHKGVYEDISELIEDNIDFYKSKAHKIYEIIEDNMSQEDILEAVIVKFNIRINNRYKYALIERLTKSYVEYLSEQKLISPILKGNRLVFIH